MMQLGLILLVIALGSIIVSVFYTDWYRKNAYTLVSTEQFEKNNTILLGIAQCLFILGGLFIMHYIFDIIIN